MMKKKEDVPFAETNRPDVMSNIQAERAILGAILLDNALFDAAKVLDPDDFMLDAHRLIFSHIAQMIERGEAADIVTLAEELRSTHELDKIGELPVAYIASLGEDTIRYRPAVYSWAGIVKGKSLLRQLAKCCDSALKKTYDGESGMEIITCLRGELDDIERQARTGLRSELEVKETHERVNR